MASCSKVERVKEPTLAELGRRRRRAVNELVADRLWISEMPLRLFGVELGTRMSVVRLSGEGGGLWLHSPVTLHRSLREELDGLGRVRFVVCPNRGHHMFAGEYFAAYPDASFYAAPGLSEKRPDLPFDGVLGDEPEPGWAQDLKQAIFRGERLLREVMFYHQESRTLIVTDLVQSADSGSPLLMRLVMRLSGIYERPGPHLYMKLLFRDKAAARASLERILSWVFDRILLCHGPIVESGGKAVFREAYSFLS
jgi:hypothetical protein